MHIAICDDEADFVQRILDVVRQADCYRPDWKLSAFYSGDQLLFEYEKNRHPFDIVILDIKMEGTDGLSAGISIRRRDSASILLYLTAYSQFSLAAYDAFPLYYMVKPIQTRQFHHVLKKACALVEKKQQESIHICGREIERFLPLSEISHLESRGHSVVIHTTDQKSLNCPGTLKSVLERIEKPHFIRIHKSFAINLYEVLSFHHVSRQATMKGGAILPVSRTRLHEFSKRFIEVHTHVDPL